LPEGIAQLVRTHQLPWVAECLTNGSVRLIVTRPADLSVPCPQGWIDGPPDMFDGSTWMTLLLADELE